MKQIFILSFALLCFMSCTDKTGYNISGEVTNASSTELFLEKISQQNRAVIDTVTIEADGNFLMEGPLEEAGIFRLRNQAQQGVVLHLKPGSDVDLSINFDDVNNYEVTGSDETQRFKEFNEFYAQRNKEKQELIASYRTEQDSTAKATSLATLQGWDDETAEIVKEKIQQEPSSLLGILMIGAVPAQKNKQFYNDFNDRVQLEIPNSEYAKEFGSIIEQVNSAVIPPQIGETPPDIAMASPNGDVIKLSDLKGKYVLLDFWAAWCKPCRQENPNIVNAYKKYNDKGFEVFSVSLDRNAEAWTRAISQDNLEWNYHVSDLKYWDNAAAKQYGVKSIPTSYLLDESGKIIAMNLRGEILHQKLAELFSN